MGIRCKTIVAFNNCVLRFKESADETKATEEFPTSSDELQHLHIPEFRAIYRMCVDEGLRSPKLVADAAMSLSEPLVGEGGATKKAAIHPSILSSILSSIHPVIHPVIHSIHSIHPPTRHPDSDSHHHQTD